MNAFVSSFHLDCHRRRPNHRHCRNRPRLRLVVQNQNPNRRRRLKDRRPRVVEYPLSWDRCCSKQRDLGRLTTRFCGGQVRLLLMLNTRRELGRSARLGTNREFVLDAVE